MVVGCVYSREAVAARTPGWLSSVMALLLPGLPTNVLDFAERHPMAVGFVGVVVYMLRRASRQTKEAAQEYAFQVWRLALAPGPPQALGKLCRPGWAPRPFVTIGAAVGVATIIGVNLIAPQQPVSRAARDGVSSCNGAVRGDCLLASGETVLVAIRASQPRNESGVLLEKDACYSSRFVSSVRWRDGGQLQPPAEGFDFDSDVFQLKKFWWMRWLRPRPEGLWFEIVGRIDRQSRVFGLLDGTDARRVHSFVAPADGELVLQVNDVPYENNSGVMVIQLTRC